MQTSWSCAAYYDYSTAVYKYNVLRKIFWRQKVRLARRGWSLGDVDMPRVKLHSNCDSEPECIVQYR